MTRDRGRGAARSRLERIPLELAGRQLVYLAVIVELGSFARAAEVLHLTQPALSKSMRSLERVLRMPLLKRTSRGVVPTTPGETLLKHAQEVMGSLRRARTELERLQGLAPGRVPCGIGRGVPAPLFAAALARVVGNRPAASFVIVEGSTRRLLAALRDRELDVALLSGPVGTIPPHVSIEPLRADRGAIVARAGHPLGRRSNVTLEALAAARWVLPPAAHPLRQRLDTVFAAHDALPKLMMQTASLTLAIEVVGRTDALAMLPVTAIGAALERHELIEVACHGLDWAMPLALATRNPDDGSILARAFAQALREEASLHTTVNPAR